MHTNLQEAQSNFNYLAQCASEGEAVIISKYGKPYVQLLPLKKKQRIPGGLLYAMAGRKIPSLHEIHHGDREIEELFESSI